LTDLLKVAPLSVSEEQLKNLTIFTGSGDDIAAVKPMFESEPVDFIVFGLGSLPDGFQMSLKNPIKVQQPTICADSANTILTALRELSAAKPDFKKPFMVVISSTGVQGALGTVNKEDVPTLMAPLYHWILAMPHQDKNAMELAVATEDDKTDAVLSGWSVIRPTLLSSAPPKGVDNIRFGWQNKQGSGPGPAKGYQVSRSDVGAFIFEKILKDTAEWNGKVVTLTN
jgi:hypothetical protein